MRAVVQRVSKASVTVEGEITGAIENGFLVLLGVEDEDERTDVVYLVDKITGLRVFEDKEGKMNLSLMDVKGEMLVVSQFTLLGDCRKGKRPSFIKAARPEKAKELYQLFVQGCITQGIKVEEGIFQAEMSVNLCNEGPVTILLDSKKLF